MQFQLPAWRPGRYELADFAQNIQKWDAFDQDNNRLSFKKITKDLWEVETKGSEEITVVYNFYANQLDAGACYLDENQLYLNPVHCMFYIVDRMEEAYQLDIEIPENYFNLMQSRYGGQWKVTDHFYLAWKKNRLI